MEAATTGCGFEPPFDGPTMDLEWLNRFDVHLRAAAGEVSRLRDEHSIMDTELVPIAMVLLTMREELDCAFMACDPDCQPEQEYARPARRVGENRKQ